MQAIRMSCTPRFFSSGHIPRPEFCALVIADPEAQGVLLTVILYAYGRVHGLVDHPAFAAGLYYNGIKVDDGIEWIQGPVLPFPDFFDDRIDSPVEINSGETSTP